MVRYIHDMVFTQLIRYHRLELVSYTHLDVYKRQVFTQLIRYHRLELIWQRHYAMPNMEMS